MPPDVQGQASPRRGRPWYIVADRATLQNVRLWNPEIVKQGFSQLQSLRPYYDFPDADIVLVEGFKRSALPKIEVDPETYAVRADGELLVCEPASVLPMAQRYFLF